MIVTMHAWHLSHNNQHYVAKFNIVYDNFRVMKLMFYQTQLLLYVGYFLVFLTLTEYMIN